MKGQPRRELEREHAHNYKLEQVVADLVDNAIDAQANNVWVIFDEETYNDRDSFYIIVVNDGKGIPSEEISSVMDFGAPRDYDELDLGKFGVGMKASSLSQAREITLISKVSGQESSLRRLSSKIVEEKDDWVLIDTLEDQMHTDALAIAKRELANLNFGTAIVLEDMHKLRYRIGDESVKQSYMAKESTHIRDYLGLAFERYLSGTTLSRSDGTSVDRKLQIYLNGKSDVHKVRPLDPFCKGLKDGTVKGTLSLTRELEFTVSENVAIVQVSIWIIPKDSDRKNYCSQTESNYDNRMRNAGRDKGISELQGLYVYRNERLIDFGGWKGLYKIEPHVTCDRWEIHFPPSLDKVFQLDPSKREVILPASIFETMKVIAKKRTRWHEDDARSVGHRQRARTRQSGKDIPHKKKPPRGPRKRASPPTTVEITELSGSETGQIFVNERNEGGVLKLILNTKHPLYPEFIQKMKKL